MSSVVSILVLLLAVVVSAPLARLIRAPLPLAQVALGAAGVPFLPPIEFEPEVFFLLFLPPLLFLDGWRIPKDDLLRDRATVLHLAVGLVVLTVLGVGLFVHWMIPAMPLPVAFALAAVISPTDPIAVSAIAARAPIPRRMMHILEGEALLNDASGLVCLRFAVAAMLTGTFVLHEALLTFLWLAIGGLAVGIGVTWGVARTKWWVSRRLGEDTSAHILVSLLIPFGAYLLADRLHCSGILAVAAAGVTMAYTEQTGQTLAITRVRRAGVWETVQFAANGVIFVLLGEQMPRLLARADEVVRSAGHTSPWWLAAYVAAISLALAALRFAWVWVSLRVTLVGAGRKGTRKPEVSTRLIAAMSLAGVRGAVTLAGVLTVPLTLGDGSPFPARDLAVFLAAGVILASLAVAAVMLPRVLRGVELPAEPSGEVQVDEARLAAAYAAIRAIGFAQRRAVAGARPDAALYAEAAGPILALYRQRVEGRPRASTGEAVDRRFDEIERELRLVGLNAERDEIFRRARARELQDEAARRLVREIDLLEARYGTSTPES